MEKDKRKDGAVSFEDPAKAVPSATASRRVSTFSTHGKTANFFIGDEGNKMPVKIVGPDDQEIPADEIIVPPDGGYGYVIVLAAFFSNVIVDGIVFSYGSIKDSIQNDPHLGSRTLDPSTVAWVGSLLTGFYLLTGPFVSAIASKFGFRTVAILGSAISSFGFAMSWYLNPSGEPPNIAILIGFYGVVAGIGFSCIYVPAVIAVGFYFEKKRALATGIAICGSGIGNFIFPVMISRLIPIVGWQRTILILAFIVLLCGLLGLLYRPLTAKKSRRMSTMTNGGSPDGTPLLMRIKRARDMMKWDSVNSFISNRGESFSDVQQKDRKHSTVSLKTGAHPAPVPGMQTKRASVPTMLTSTGDSPGFLQAAGVLVNVPSKAAALKAKSFIGLPDLHETEEDDERGSREKTAEPEEQPMKKFEPPPPQPKNTSSYNLLDNRNASGVSCRIGNSMLTVDDMTNSRIIRVASRVTLNKPLYRDDIFYSGSLYRIPDYANNMLTSTEWTAAVTRPPDEEEDEEVHIKNSESCCGHCDVVKKMLDFSLLVSPTFIVFSISGMFSMLGMFVPFVFLMDQAFNVIRDEEGNQVDKLSLSILLSLIGIANTVGRILSGWIADRPFINALILNNCAVTVMGLSTMMVPLLRSLPQFMCYSCTFGISMACFASLRSILVVELMGLSKLTNAFGLLLLFQGIASMVATPLAGFLSTGDDFSLPFYAAGGFMLFSAVMCYPLNKLNKWEKRRNRLH